MIGSNVGKGKLYPTSMVWFNELLMFATEPSDTTWEFYEYMESRMTYEYFDLWDKIEFGGDKR